MVTILVKFSHPMAEENDRTPDYTRPFPKFLSGQLLADISGLELFSKISSSGLGNSIQENNKN